MSRNILATYPDLIQATCLLSYQISGVRGRKFGLTGAGRGSSSPPPYQLPPTGTGQGGEEPVWGYVEVPDESMRTLDIHLRQIDNSVTKKVQG